MFVYSTTKKTRHLNTALLQNWQKTQKLRLVRRLIAEENLIMRFNLFSMHITYINKINTRNLEVS